MPLERLALSKLALKMKLTPSLRQVFRSEEATWKHIASFSMTQGPAIKVNCFDRRNEFQMAESSSTRCLCTGNGFGRQE